MATRLTKGFRRLPYEVRLRRLGLHFLRSRCLRGHLIVLYKCFLGDWIWTPAFFLFLQMAWREWLSFQSSAGSLLVHLKKVVIKYCNRLTTPVVTAPSVNSVNRQLASTWDEMFTEVPAKFRNHLLPYPYLCHPNP